MTDVTFLLDRETGNLILEGSNRPSGGPLREVAKLLGPGKAIGCAKPPEVLGPPSTAEMEPADGVPVRVHGYYHNSLIEGPGRRSCVLLSGCNLGCRGCWVLHLQSVSSGLLVPANRLADALLDPRYQRDGVSIAGGEPFMQPTGLLALVHALRERGCPHILVYTGHRYEDLLARSRSETAVGAILDGIDMLIDGPYIEALASSAGPWTGSGNQRVIDMAATRLAHRVKLASQRGTHASGRLAAPSRRVVAARQGDRGGGQFGKPAATEGRPRDSELRVSQEEEGALRRLRRLLRQHKAGPRAGPAIAWLLSDLYGLYRLSGR